MKISDLDIVTSILVTLLADQQALLVSPIFHPKLTTCFEFEAKIKILK